MLWLRLRLVAPAGRRLVIESPHPVVAVDLVRLLRLYPVVAVVRWLPQELVIAVGRRWVAGGAWCRGCGTGGAVAAGPTGRRQRVRSRATRKLGAWRGPKARLARGQSRWSRALPATRPIRSSEFSLSYN